MNKGFIVCNPGSLYASACGGPWADSSCEGPQNICISLFMEAIKPSSEASEPKKCAVRDYAPPPEPQRLCFIAKIK